ncbi:MAG: recombinase family protein [Acetatifactor muris]|nr:recombinase family protein [Acetatifactor muris]
MADAKRGLIGCIIVKDFSRFGRDHLETGNYLERIFPLLGIRFISINDQFDSSDCTGMTGGMSVALKNIINSMYSRDLSKKVKSATRTRAARGEYVGAFAPYGYVKNLDNMHQLIPDKEAAEVVKLVFTMAAEGKRKPEIARFLNGQGIPTCMEHFQAMGIKRKSHNEKEKKLWTITTIGDMLKNEVYLGKTIWNRTRKSAVGSKRQIKNDRSEWIIAEGTHEPLVTQELFDMANAKAFTHEKKNVPTGRKAKPLFICPYCGRRLAPTSWGNAYRCGQAAVSNIAGCKTVHVDKKLLENAILSCTRTMAGMVSAEAGRKIKEGAQISAIEEKIRMLEAEGKRLSARKLRLYEDYRSDRLTKEQYRREYESAAGRILEIEKKIPELKDEAVRIREQALHMEEREAELEGLLSLGMFDKDKLLTVIDRVLVYSEERIEIIWKMNDGFFSETAEEKETVSLQ